MHDVIIIGSGLAGTGAALELCDAGVQPLMLDVGVAPPLRSSIDENLYEYRRRHDTYDAMIGASIEGLSNLAGTTDVPVKLTAPSATYVTEQAGKLSPIDENAFNAIQSFALGGLANAWGAGCYRFTRADMQDFPFSAGELDPFFDRLTAEIGISGTDDDLTQDFGSADGLQPPLNLGRNVGAFYDHYRRMKNRPAGIRMGRARVGALTRPLGDRPVTSYRSLEFFQEERSLYSPRYTVERLASEGRLLLRRNTFVRAFRDDGDGVTVFVENLAGGSNEEIRARRLILAAGAIGTSRIVLASFDDHDTKLPLQENAALQFPLVVPAAIGRKLQTDAFGLVQLNLIWDSPGYGMRLQGSIMEITAPARAEFFRAFPYAARSNLKLIRHMLPGMMVMQLFFPGSAQPPAALSLRSDGTLHIEGAPNTLDRSRLRPLLWFLLRLGAVTVPRLIVRVPTGHAVHYACTLPMHSSPDRYQCYPDGRLHGTGRVYVADSAAFTSLPAKNMSFAMMANAMRVARAAATGESEQ